MIPASFFITDVHDDLLRFLQIGSKMVSTAMLG